MTPSTQTAVKEQMLVFRTGQLGDMIVSLPAMWVVRRQWPHANLTLLCDVHPGRNYVLGSDVFQGAGLFDEFEHYEIPVTESNPLATVLRRLKLLLRLRARGGRSAAGSLRSPAVRSAASAAGSIRGPAPAWATGSASHRP